jgi:hypothetical protein
MPIVAVGNDGIIWGLGPTEEQAELDAVGWLSEAESSADETTLTFHTVSLEQAKLVNSGVVDWSQVKAS